MPLRTDEQRDHCIDALLRRVKALEDEVARLKIEQLFAEDSVEPPVLDPDATLTDTVSPPEPTDHAGRAADSSLESAIGTRWIGRVGVLAILFGVAFFLKYSFDNRLIGETGRVVLGICWGAAFIGAGEFLRKKREMELYSQMLSGGGLAVLYLALYAAFALYHLAPAPLAAAGMLAVTSTGMTLAVRYSAYSLAAIALLGGFLTPLMLSTGQNQPITLFGYLLLLDTGTLLLLRFRHWPSLAVASLVGTALLYAGWHAEFFTVEQRWLAFGIVALFYLFYTACILSSRLRWNRAESQSDQLVIFGSAAFFFLAFFSQQQWEANWTVTLFTLILAGCEIGQAILVRRRAPAARLTVASYAAASAILTVIATFVALEQRWLMPALAA